jgi:hypothetical protein
VESDVMDNLINHILMTSTQQLRKVIDTKPYVAPTPVREPEQTKTVNRADLFRRAADAFMVAYLDDKSEFARNMYLNCSRVAIMYDRGLDTSEVGSHFVDTAKTYAEWAPTNFIDDYIPNNNSGQAVCMNHNGTIIAVGSPNDADGNCVRVYSQLEPGSEWVKIGNDINDGTPYNYSGSSIAMNGEGNIIAVGSPNGEMGNVMIYHINNDLTNWVPHGKLEGVNSFGCSISMNGVGTRIIVGSFNETKDNSFYGSGCARIYEYGGQPDVWNMMYEIPDEFYSGQTGMYVSMNLDGNLVAVSAPTSYNYMDGQPGCGSIRCFVYDNVRWNQRGAHSAGPEIGGRSRSGSPRLTL